MASRKKRWQEPEITLFVMIPSHQVETYRELDVDGVYRYYVYGSVNGKAFRVVCDEPAYVLPEVAEALKSLMQ